MTVPGATVLVVGEAESAAAVGSVLGANARVITVVSFEDALRVLATDAVALVVLGETTRAPAAERESFVEHVRARALPIVGAIATPTKAESAIERERLERLAERLREDEDRLRLALDSAGLGTWEFDPAARNIQLDARCRAILGVEIEPTVPLAAFLALLHPYDRDTTDAALQRALDPATGGYFGTEFRMAMSADGFDRWIGANARAVVDRAGRPHHLVGTMLDITSRHDAEQQRLRLLETEAWAREEAEAANRAKDAFLATISHELRTPLNAILGWTAMLRAGTVQESRRERALETVERNARLQAQLIEDLLDVSRITAGQLRLHLELLDLTGVVQAALDASRPAAEAKSIVLESAIDAVSRAPLGDAARLQQVVSNLVTNAVKFTPPGGRVTVELHQLDSEVELVVRDEGQGISAEFLPFVFDAFRQADAAVSRRHGGLGLGLAIVRRLVELHGGTVHAHSDGIGRGARFVVKIPLPERAESVHSNRIESVGLDDRADARTAALAGLRVLVVDDEADGRELISFVLEDAMAEVATADSAATAFAMVQSARPHVLVCDIGMPGEDGYSLIRRVRALPVLHGGTVPALALTAYSGSDDRMRAIMAGFQLHAAKPIEPGRLIGLVMRLARRTAEPT